MENIFLSFSIFIDMVFGCDSRRYLGKLFSLVSRGLSELWTRTIQAFLKFVILHYNGIEILQLNYNSIPSKKHKTFKV